MKAQCKQSFIPIVLLLTNTNAFLPSHHTKANQKLYSKMDMLDESSWKTDEILSTIEEMIFDSSWKEDQLDLLTKVDKEHEMDVQSSLFEKESKSNSTPISYDFVTTHLPSTNQDHTIAARTKETLLNKEEIKQIVDAAEDHWRKSSNKQRSRFTYQRKGNSEAHISDLGPKVQSIMNEMLQTKVYPLLRQIYPNKQPSTLSVYDALMIRYNANEALEQNSLGAGQPLHRDLGLYSINIALNTNTSFMGGGTFFEHQLHSDNEPLKPFGVGHAIIHRSNERHAGAATYQGIRDILVLFITERHHNGSWKTPNLEFNARLKANAMSIPNSKIMHHHLAVQMNPYDGEAWLYLAQSLRQYQHSQNLDLFFLILQCLEKASIYSSCDARVFNDLGLAWMDLQKTNENPSTNIKIQTYLKRSIMLHTLADKAGCQVGMDADAAKLNLGLHYANLDDFQNAVQVLKTITTSIDTSNTTTLRDFQQQRVWKDAQTLFQFCERQISKK